MSYLDKNGLQRFYNGIKTNVTPSTVAEIFDATESYSKGKYVYYNNVLYKFISDHSGSWNSNDVVQVTISDELSEVDLAKIMIDNDYVVVKGYPKLTVDNDYIVIGSSFKVTIRDDYIVIGQVSPINLKFLTESDIDDIFNSVFD